MEPLLVDARSRLSYGFFYLLGWHGPIRFTKRGFEDIGTIDPFRTILPVIVGDRRFVIDLGDSAEIAPEAREWADVYGKVNCTPEQVRSGVVPLGPGFGARPSMSRALRYSLTPAVPMEGAKAGLADRRNLLLRTARIEEFVPGVADPAYLFSVNSLWEWEDTQQRTNRWRAEWMRTARDNPWVDFEGGFLPRPNSELGKPQGPQEDEFADLLLPTRVPIRRWIANTQRSFAVFNTPAVHSCHGWKLGQYLAMGKAIVSTPLPRALPSPLVPGEHLHLVNDPAGLLPAMELLRQDEEYRRHLQENARRYWLTHLQPEIVMKRLLAS